ncbi:MAG: DUF1302 family protein [Limnobacter sp.]|jgi:Protein of unknown function (DUF1302)|uniref:DUF1302 family protein n=1 Tax=Limnobacter TaxID=131079 RepID=UPI0007A8CC4D|nr:MULTISPECIES: DUF1302 family protein [Limnobacter]KYP10940.1 MAG: cox2 cytochrome oxidase subunit 2 [Limnobacter sp. CACIAM 66H1]MDP3271237.1 DUF1302 family protein [Limnobacter sp.]MDZ4050831.1 DUF1302 family protein [Limnobacter sp.]RZO91075.1 MAG: DUF1302 family protein [Limnobacter sp.]
MKKMRHKPALRSAVLAAALLGALPGIAKAATFEGEDYEVDLFYENHTAFRGKDNTDQTVGIAKFRNTLIAEGERTGKNGWRFNGIFRGTYDGVYHLNPDQFGKTAGGPIMLESTAIGGSVPQGGGLGFTAVNGAFGLPNNQFVDNYPNNPNEGLRVSGDRWHGTNGGAAFGVPVRPCDVDPRGCVDFGGYGDLTFNELAAPEFNSRLDFIREAYATNTFALKDGTDLFVKVGKQQVVWGRTDLFRVLDVINPVDFSRNNIYDELEDIRIPMWIAQAEWRLGPSETMQDRNLQVVWNFDQFRPNNLGQCGQPNVILDAGCLFRGLKNLWDNGGTVANFASNGMGQHFATNFGPNQIGIRNVELPDWKLDNTQLGLKYEGITQEGLSFSVNALTYRSQLPSLRGIQTGAVNPFTGTPQTTANTHLIAFDFVYPRVNLIGGSLDFQLESAGAAVRVEAAMTEGEEFANTLRPQLYSENNVFRAVVGVDRPTFIDWINPRRTTLISGQLFLQHILDHEVEQKPLGLAGMPDWETNAIGTLLIKAFLANDRISPTLIMAHDVRAKATAIAPSVEWLVTDNLKLVFGANFKVADNSKYQFDDCRSCNPYAPFTQYAGDGQGAAPGSFGLGGFEPLGRFRAGPIGAAFKEDDLFVQMRYNF